ncbi:TIGR03618 family F420-dependent PPOX class oxidoreductase [Allokutzneria sp. A3M-2-11 16]|uniref:TIGR03618 family F420-dependent PPOX class oxidoreductase n=1 Tax=Allokutzneria sp. A3M-2-11 16 TaxID=2962043 RepID=UPI0020B750E0|nr:TIGR03618 family F420-dependent PPOX class oxidoreductase [Allokutzneria sp. A3M-2-11 16]MCP3803016.1 TIGR03618 family F420-dependent PPOX class oxidoreductase [Allokutzneria sp. A3M-2-11 16]
MSDDKPKPRSLGETEIDELLAAHQFGVVATVKKDGTPHLTTMLYRWDPAERVVRISTTASRAKPGHVRRHPRAALHVAAPDHMTFTVVEGVGEVSEVSTTPGDATGRELLAMAGEVPDEAAFLAEMVAEQRLVLRVKADSVTGTTLAQA